ncbi:single-minded homolog 2-like [Octopus sinensis]|uniref:Single-minded homolog 2-like n=1 Tax=Octopus sinensis TaxID=2607531 RepID=A0A6P7U144_9MOLL|nr:single-minded homolog 2-like [Octopus sinensis]
MEHENTAKIRRRKENQAFVQIAEKIPISDSITKNLDKASLLRLLSAFVELKQIFKGYSAIHSTDVHQIDQPRQNTGICQEIVGTNFNSYILYKDSEEFKRCLKNCQIPLSYTGLYTRQQVIFRIKTTLPKRIAGLTFENCKYRYEWHMNDILEMRQPRTVMTNLFSCQAQRKPDSECGPYWLGN